MIERCWVTATREWPVYNRDSCVARVVLAGIVVIDACLRTWHRECGRDTVGPDQIIARKRVADGLAPLELRRVCALYVTVIENLVVDVDVWKTSWGRCREESAEKEGQER